jgi:signal transduction histidine kinase/CheY-like chemotaxis protein
MQKFFPFPLLLIFTLLSHPVNAGSDSLWEIANASTGLKKIKTLIALGDRYKRQDSMMLAENTYNMALDHIDLNNATGPELIKLNLQAQLGLAGIYLLRKADYEKSLNLLLNTLPTVQKLNDTLTMASIYYYLSLNYRLISKYEKAMAFLNETIPLSEACRDTALLISCFNEKANLLYYLNEKNLSNSFRMKALTLAKKTKNLRAQGYINHDIGLFALLNGKYQEAIDFFRINLRTATQEKDVRGICITALNISDAYMHLNKTDSVYHYLHFADSVSQKHTMIAEQADVLHKFTGFYVSKGNYRLAYEYLNRFAEAKDTILNIEMKKQIEELDAIYQNDKNQSQIKAQREELARSELVIKQKNIISFLLSGGIALLLVLGVAILRNLRIKRRANNLLSAKNEEILAQKLQIETANNELMRHRDQLESIVEERTRDLISAKEKAEESDRLKTAFLQNISHEIRTPMNGILGFLSLLRETDLSTEDQDLYFTLIKQSSARMLNTVTDIMDISKIEAALVQPRYTTTNLNELTRKLVTQYRRDAEQEGVELRLLQITPGDWDTRIVTDREKLNTIIAHLLRNAIKYTEYGAIELGYSLEGNSIHIYVNDTGIGIPADRIHAIFDRFVQAEISDTRQHEGSGLGLTISKAYVEMLGGKIMVESTQGKGSRFAFTIPYLPAGETGTDPETSPLPEAGPVKLKKLKMIIAEDDELNGMYLKSILQSSSSGIFMAQNGAEAIALLEQHPDTDLILMDIKMPGMDGFETTHLIRQTNPDIIIIAQTAYALAGDRETALEAGINDYITKPINKELLLELIGNVSKFRANP